MKVFKEISKSSVNFYLIAKSKKENKGHPIFFNYDFVKDSCGNTLIKKEDSFYYNQCKNDELLFICKHRMINFDFVDISSGEYFVSKKFLQALNKDEKKYQLKKVRFISSKGESITKKEYFVIRIAEILNAVDLEHSIIKVSKAFNFIKNTELLELKESIIGNRELFTIDNDTFAGMLFCSENYKISAEVCGVDISFIPVKDAVKHIKSK